MITKRTSTTEWNNFGSDTIGHGIISTNSNCINDRKIYLSSRFDENSNLNPEELISAAHSSCFTMSLIKLLTRAGYKDLKIKTDCSIKFDVGGIIESCLFVHATILNLNERVFLDFIEQAKNESFISKTLSIKISISCNFNSNKIGLPDVAILGRNL